MSVKSFSGLSKAIVFNSFVDVILNGLLLFIGLGLFAYYQAGAGGGSSDKTLVYYIINVLPNGVSGLIITAIFAAAMSSVDSGINSVSAVIVTDFVKPMREKALSEVGEVTLARWLTVFIGGCAIATAFVAGGYGSIVRAWNAVISLFSGPVLAIFLLGILTKKANFVGWLIGAVIAIGATYWLQSSELMHWIYDFPFCFIVSFVLGGIFSVVIHYLGKLFSD